MVFSTTILIVIVASFVTLGLMAKRKPWVTCILAILVGACGFTSYVHHQEVMGIPVEIKWSQLGDRFTVIFFRVEDDSRIIMWLEGDRLVSCPFVKEAEEALESEREEMGRGVPVTFGTSEDSQNTGGDLGSSDGDGSGEGVKGGWPYEQKSSGGTVNPGELPPKL